MAAFRAAQRQSAKPLVGLYSESGCGKTYGALVIARGFVGPSGRIAMIETESGRGESYADPREYPELNGGGASNYDVLSLRDDFAPAQYKVAIKEAEKQKYDALIIDSVSHEWEGPGGVLAMAQKNQEAGTKGVLVWQQPKLKHQSDFMLPMMQTSVPLVILCMRAKYPMEQKTMDGKKEWVRASHLEPKQSDDILYEMFVHGWIDQAHKFHLTKTTAKALADVFKDGQALDLDTGRNLAQWAKGDAPAVTQHVNGLDALKAEGEEAAEGGTEVLKTWWRRVPSEQRKLLTAFKDEILKPKAVAADAQPTEKF